MTRQTEEDGLKWSLLKQILKVWRARRIRYIRMCGTAMLLCGGGGGLRYMHAHDKESWRPPLLYYGLCLGE